MRIQAKLTAMAAEEILRLIDSSEYLRIKAQDPNPLFRAYVIGHEGTFKPQAEGIGTIITKWFAAAVRKLVSVLQFGTPIFHGHDDSNSHIGRASIGEVVGKSLEIIKNKLSAVAVVYIKPPFRDLKLDVASIEADVDLLANKDTGSFDADIRDITGVALADSAVEKPAFRGATLVGEMQAFLADNQSFIKGTGGDMGLTIGEVRTFIKSENLSPGDLFGAAILTGDSIVEDHIQEQVKKLVGEHYRGKRKDTEYEETLETLKKKHEDEAKELQTANATLKTQVIEGKVPSLVTKIKEERKLDKSQAAFIDLKVKGWTPEKLEDVEKELNTFTDKAIVEHQKLGTAVYGLPEKKEPGTGGGETNDPDPSEPEIEEMALE